MFAGFKVLAEGQPIDFEEEKQIGAHLVLRLKEGQESVVSKMAILHSDRNPDQTLEDAWEHGMALLQAVHSSYGEIYQQNRLYWDNFWAKSDITIEGDADTQQGIRFCIFQMQQTYRGAIRGRQYRRQRADRRGL